VGETGKKFRGETFDVIQRDAWLSGFSHTSLLVV
jgi:hypothetical protein